MRRTVRGDHASQAIAVASFSLPAQVTPALHQVVRGNVAYKPAPKYDWTAFDALTNAEVLKAACSDPDAQPLSDVQSSIVCPFNAVWRWRAVHEDRRQVCAGEGEPELDRQMLPAAVE